MHLCSYSLLNAPSCRTLFQLLFSNHESAAFKRAATYLHTLTFPFSGTRFLAPSFTICRPGFLTLYYTQAGLPLSSVTMYMYTLHTCMCICYTHVYAHVTHMYIYTLHTRICIRYTHVYAYVTHMYMYFSSCPCRHLEIISQWIR